MFSVPIDEHGDGLGSLARDEREFAARRLVVNAALGCSVQGSEINGLVLEIGVCQTNREREIGCSHVTFRHLYIIDCDGGRVVIQNVEQNCALIAEGRATRWIA